MSRHRARLWKPPTMRSPKARAGARRVGVAVSSSAVVALMLGVAYVASPAAGPAPAPAAAATVDPTTAEAIYLNELRYAGLELTPDEQQAAVEIARKHVAHGHLVGMRHWILSDFAEQIPRLSEEQRDVARVAVEHHFQEVTGRKQ